MLKVDIDARYFRKGLFKLQVFSTTSPVVRSFYKGLIDKLSRNDDKIPIVLSLEQIEKASNQYDELNNIRKNLSGNERLDFDLAVIMSHLKVYKYYLNAVGLVYEQADELFRPYDDLSFTRPLAITENTAKIFETAIKELQGFKDRLEKENR